jgi:hypothetical protein
MHTKTKKHQTAMLVMAMITILSLACGAQMSLFPTATNQAQPSPVENTPEATVPNVYTYSPTDAELQPQPEATSTTARPTKTPAAIPTKTLAGPWGTVNTLNWKMVASGGFGDPNNIYADMAEYKGYLYVSTFSYEDNRPISGSDKSGGDIWRSQDGSKWERVAAKGLGIIHNVGLRLMPFQDQFFVGSVNNWDGTTIWKSPNALYYTPLVVRGLGDAENVRVSFVVYKDVLIVGTCNPTHGAEIWATKDGARFKKVVTGENGNQKNSCFITGHEPSVVFKDYLYFGTTNKEQGGEIWRSADGFTWEVATRGGIGNITNDTLRPDFVFKDQLYVESYNNRGFDLFRSSDGKKWEKVIQKGLNAAPDNSITCRLDSLNDNLYLVTTNKDRRIIKQNPEIVLAPAGFQLWKSPDGANWTQVGPDGFGNLNNTTANIKRIGDYLYIETGGNFADGGEVWRSKNGQDWEMIFKQTTPNIFQLGVSVTSYKDHLLVIANDQQYGMDIWREQ